MMINFSLKMKVIPLVFLILGTFLEMVDAILNLPIIADPPMFFSITSNSIQVFLFLLATIFSLINIISKQEKTLHFFITFLSVALFIARLGWLLSWI